MKKLLLFSIIIFFACITATQAQVLFDAHSGDGREIPRKPIDASLCEGTIAQPCLPSCMLIARCDYEQKLLALLPDDTTWLQIFLPGTVLSQFEKKDMTTAIIFKKVTEENGIYKVAVKICYTGNIENDRQITADDDFAFIYITPDLYLSEIRMI